MVQPVPGFFHKTEPKGPESGTASPDELEVDGLCMTIPPWLPKLTNESISSRESVASLVVTHSRQSRASFSFVTYVLFTVTYVYIHAGLRMRKVAFLRVYI